MPIKQVDEIPILRNDDRIRLTCCFKDLKVGRIAKADITQGRCRKPERFAYPACYRRRNLSVDPDHYAASGIWGWSSLRAA